MESKSNEYADKREGMNGENVNLTINDQHGLVQLAIARCQIIYIGLIGRGRQVEDAKNFAGRLCRAIRTTATLIG